MTPADRIEKTFKKSQQVSEEYARLLGPGTEETGTPDRIERSFELGEQSAAHMADIVRPTPSRKRE